MRIALNAKNKLGFVDGSCVHPQDESSKNFLQWSYVDSMVTSWILNSMYKDLSEAYVYTSSTQALWLELEEKFGRGDKMCVFNIKHQLATIKQGTDSLVVYSNNLRKLWEEFHCLETRKKCVCSGCNCDSRHSNDEVNPSDQVMQFLLGLHESYEVVSSTFLRWIPFHHLIRHIPLFQVLKTREVQVLLLLLMLNIVL